VAGRVARAVLTIACAAAGLAIGIAVQFPVRSSDPPNQTDRVFMSGWPLIAHRTGGIMGRSRWDRAALAENLGLFVAAGVGTGLLAGCLLPRRTT
jgi:hypothetical protein